MNDAPRRSAHAFFRGTGEFVALLVPSIVATSAANMATLLDRAMVAPLGADALAAQGLGAQGYALLVALFTGLAPAVLGAVAMSLGAAGRGEAILKSGIAMGVVASIPALAVFLMVAPSALHRVLPLQSVAQMAIDYVMPRAIGLPLLAIDLAFTGYWYAHKRTRLLLWQTLASNGVNFFLNWVLIYGNLGVPALGLQGAGLASVVASAVGPLWSFLMVRSEVPTAYREATPAWGLARALVKPTVAAGLQPVLNMGGIFVLFSIAGGLGTRAVAVTVAVYTVLLIPYWFAAGAGRVGAAFVGRELGADRRREAGRWGWLGGVLALPLVALVVVPICVAAEPLLSVLLEAPDATALRVIRIAMCSMLLDAPGTVFLYSLVATDRAWRAVSVEAVLMWAIGLPLAYVLATSAGLGLLGLWLGFMSYRVLQSGVITIIWWRSHTVAHTVGERGASCGREAH